MTTTPRPTGTDATVDDLTEALATDATTLIDVREAVEYVEADSVAGGTSAWIRSGRPVSPGRDA